MCLEVVGQRSPSSYKPIKVIAAALGGTPELNGKTILLKTTF